MKTRRDFLVSAAASPFFLTDNAVAYGAPAELGFTPGLVYLNTGSAGPTPDAVLRRTLQAWMEIEKNPVFHEYSLDGVLGWAENVRAQAAEFLGCQKDELLMTRSTSEAMNTVAQSIRFKPGDHILISDQEHTGGSDCWRYLAERNGIVVDRVAIPYAVNDTKAIVQSFADAIQPRTRVISFSHILYTNGRRMPVLEISSLARSRNLLCIVDGAQAVGATCVNVKELGCHAYATTGHKWLMGPKGVGMLYISSAVGEEIKPVQWMGDKRYVGESTGVGPLPLIAGLGAALDRAAATGVDAIEQHNVVLRNRAYGALSNLPGITLMSPPPGPAATAIVSFKLPERLDSHVMRQKLTQKYGIMTRSIEKEHFNGLRVSPHIFNTDAEIDIFISAMKTELT